jgi:hypothetical protein
MPHATKLSRKTDDELQDLVGERVLFRQGTTRLQEGRIQEVSPSGEYVRILWAGRDAAQWEAVSDTKMIEVLGEPPVEKPLDIEVDVRDPNPKDYPWSYTYCAADGPRITPSRWSQRHAP